MKQTLRLGSLVLLDGKEYRVTSVKPRNEAEPLPGVDLLGNVVEIQDAEGVVERVYEWDVTLIEDNRKLAPYSFLRTERTIVKDE